MICLICRQSETVDRFTVVTLERGEFYLIVNSVPAQVCPGCGEVYVQEAVATRLLNIAREKYGEGIINIQTEYSSL